VRSGYLWLASFAAFPLIGWPLLAHPAYRRFSTACRIGLAAAAGSVLLSAGMTLLALVGIAWRPIPLVLVSGAGAFLLGRFLPKATAPDSPPEVFALTHRLASLTGIASVALALAAAASAAATSPDLVTFWGPKAQAFAAARTFDPALLRDLRLDYMHASYPPLVPSLYAFATMAAGHLPWGAATLTFPACLAVLALALPGALRRVWPGRTAAAAAAFTVATFGYLGNNLDVAGNGDPWLWLYETLALALLVGDSASTSAGQLLAGLLLAGAACAKVEGLPFAIVAAVLFLILRREAWTLSAAALLLLPGVICLGAWFGYGASRHLFYGYEQYGKLLEIHWSELPRILSGLGKVFWSAGRGLPWILPLAALLASRGKSRIAFLPLAISAVLAAFFVFTYLHQADASLWIIWSAGRVFSPLIAFLAIASVCRSGITAR
jgi:hypothetical protein